MTTTPQATHQPRTRSAPPRALPLRRPEVAIPWAHRILDWLVPFSAFVTFGAVVLVLVFVVINALPSLSQAIHLFGWAEPWSPTHVSPRFGIFPLLLGSAKVCLVALTVAMPLGIASAVYVTIFARHRSATRIKAAFELLAGVPSIVVGTFVLGSLATWTQLFVGSADRLNALVAGLAIAITVIPIVFVLAEQGLAQVPSGHVEASMALGATKSHTLVHIVLPPAWPSLAAAALLAFGRAASETVIVLLASGNVPRTELPVTVSTRTLTATLAQEAGATVGGTPHHAALYFLAVVLVLVTLTTSLLAQRIARSPAKAT